MKHQGLIYSALLMVVSFGLAYYASLPDSGDNQGKVWAELRNVTKVALYDKSKRTVVEKLQDGYFVTITHTDDVGQNSRFRANDRVESLFSSLSKFIARRVIDIADEKGLEDFGLQDPGDATFEVWDGEKIVIKFRLGRMAYGSNERYVLDMDKNKVFLTDGGSFRTLADSTENLFERRVSSYTPSASVITSLIFGEKEKTLVAKTEANGSIEWFEQGGDQVKKSYGILIKKILGLKVKRYLDTSPDAPPLFVAKFNDGENLREEVRLVGVEQSGQKQYWLHSQFLRNWVLVDSDKVELILKDFQDLI